MHLTSGVKKWHESRFEKTHKPAAAAVIRVTLRTAIMLLSLAMARALCISIFTDTNSGVWTTDAAKTDGATTEAPFIV